MTQYELEREWISDKGIPGVMFRFGNLARIVAGDDAGKSGRVVALLEIDPAPQYIIEFEDGHSCSAMQNDLELLDARVDTLVLIKE